MERRIGIIDIGSNSARLNIWRIQEDGSYAIIDKSGALGRLAEGMNRDMQLQPAAMLRAMTELKLFAHLLKAQQVTETVVLGSAALRRARNRDMFLQRCKQETGLAITVISGQEEATLAYYGVANTMPQSDGLLVDTGGGSTQLILMRNRRLVAATSLPIGAVALSETYQQDLEAIREQTQAALDSVDWLPQAQGFPIIGMGGSIRALAAIDQRQTEYPLMRMHGYTMEADRALHLIDRVQEDTAFLDSAEGMEPHRLESLYAGLMPLKCLLEGLDAPQLHISESGLREGAFFQRYLAQQPVADVLTHSLDNLMGYFHVDKIHARSVWNLTESLFEQLAPLHGLGEHMKRPLQAAALLHDIGHAVDYEAHEIHGFYMLCNARLYGLSHIEQVQAAYLVGMHRQRDFRANWRYVIDPMLTPEEHHEVEQAAVLLRLSERLDRNEQGRIERIECFVTEDRIELLLRSKQQSALQIHALLKQEGGMENIYGRTLSVV